MNDPALFVIAITALVLVKLVRGLVRLLLMANGGTNGRTN